LGDNYYGRVIFNFIGAVMRWIYGTIWRTFLNKKKFTFKEYLYGPNNPNYYDEMGHTINNVFIGILTLVFILVPLLKYIFD